MRVVSRVLLLCSALVFLATPAFAQGSKDVAVVATSGSSVGLLLNAGDHFALRPEITFGHSSTDSATAVASSSTFWSFGGGASALFFLKGTDNLRPYFSPRLVVTHSKSSSQTDGTNTYSASGSIGGQYDLGKRLAIFGEVGLNYGYAKTNTTSTTSVGSLTLSSTSKSFGTRSVVGVGIYF